MNHVWKRWLLGLMVGVLFFGGSLGAVESKVDKPYVLGFGDSGVGGLIFAMDAYRDLLPFLLQIESKYQVKFVFQHVGDTKNAPYGQKKPAEISVLTRDFVNFLNKDVTSNQVVIACNTASTVVDDEMDAYFKKLYPNTPVTAIIKKSAEALYRKAKVVTNKDGQKEISMGVLATPATVKSGRYQAALAAIHADRFGKEGVALKTFFYGPKTWVYNIEHGVSTDIKQADLESDMSVFLAQPGATSVTAVGLFCTHYPYFKHQILSYMTHHGVVGSVAVVSQGKIFAAKIKDGILSDLKAGKYEKRKDVLDVKTIKHPQIFSHITGDNLEEVKGVAKIVAPELLDVLVVSPAKIKQLQ